MNETPDANAQLVVNELISIVAERTVDLAVARARIRELEAQMDAR